MDSEDHDALNEHEIHIANVSVDCESLDLDTLCTANPLSSWMPRYGRNIVIEVRNARYALEQGASRVDAARHARDLAQRTLDIMQKEQKLGAGSNQQTLSSEHDLAVAESALVTAQTAYEKARITLKYSTGSVLDEYGISIDDAKTGVVEADNH